MRIDYDDKLHGRTVLDADGWALGSVDGAIIDDDSWRVVALRVRLRKDAAERIGVKRGVLHPAMLAVSTDLVQGVRDAVILRARTAELRAPPEKAAEEAPESRPITDEQEAPPPPSTP